MKQSKSDKQQLKLAVEWNEQHQPGITVKVKKDGGEQVETITRSEAFMLGKSGDYPGHTAVIMLEGISGAYSLDRVTAL